MATSNVVSITDRKLYSGSGDEEIANRTHALLPKENSTGFVAHISQSKLDKKYHLVPELNDAFINSTIENWDGEGAQAIPYAAYENALQLLFHIPGWIADPEIIAENDGYLSFEWYINKKTFAIFVNESDIFLYVAHYAPNRRFSGRWELDENHGVDEFIKDMMPNIRKIYA